MDALAAQGRTGTVVTVGPGIAPESDIAVFAILGYDPREEHPGRGVVEAVGAGMDFREGDLASDEARTLAMEVNEKLKLPGATFELRSTVEHRGVLVIRSEVGSLSAQVTNTDPAYRKEGSLGVALETFELEVARCEPLEDTEAAGRAAELTNAFVEGAAKILDASEVNGDRQRRGKLPANLVLTRDGGDHVPKLQAIKERFGPA